MFTTGGIGAAFPFLMNGVIGHAPPERAGSAASLAQTANEIGIALGLVVLGTIGTVVYRNDIGQAGGSWVDGLRQATDQQTRPARPRPRRLHHGFHAAGLTSLAVMVVVLLVRVRRERDLT